MTNAELQRLLDTMPPEAFVVVLPENDPPQSIKEVVPETHTDADGSTTIWLKVEEI